MIGNISIALDFSFMHHILTSTLFVVGRGGAAGGKFRITTALPVGAVINCADNTGECFLNFVYCIIYLSNIEL